MKVTVIVPAFNEAELLGHSLRMMDTSAEVIRRRGGDVEFVVCDNNSTDRTAEIARAFGAAVVVEPINQIARARNRGAATATGDWFWFIDADSRPSPDLFEATFNAIERGDVVAVGTTLEFENVDLFFRLGATIWKAWSLIFSHMAGSFIAVDARAFSEVGGFSLDYYAGEELDLSRRLQRWGRKQQPRRRVHVLRGVPLQTSGRKARLYGFWESVRFLIRAVFLPLRTMKSRDACFLWYDGRRETAPDDSSLKSESKR